MVSITKFKITNKSDFSALKAEIIRKWLELEHIPGIFRYKLNVRKQVILPGRFKFVAQLNTERTTLRRPPQVINTIVPDFVESAFNFNKANPLEKLLEYENASSSTFLVNASPLTKYHSLICPRLTENLPQVLTTESICTAIGILTGFQDRHFRIGYNSPGALASVNHLHLHLFYIEEELYVEKAVIHHLTKNIYELDKDCPVNGYCFPIEEAENDDICNDVSKLVQYFCANNIPHNLFFSLGDFNGKEIVKIFVFPRSLMCDVKEFTNFNAACCEVAGFVPVGREEVFDELTEEIIIQKIRKDMGDIPNLQQKICGLFSSS